MRRFVSAVLSIISLLVALGAVAAAQTQITIGASTSGTIQFSRAAFAARPAAAGGAPLDLRHAAETADADRV